MAIGSALVLFAVVWFMVLFVVLPIRLTTQGDAGERVPGTPAGAPHRLNMKRKIWITTGVAIVVWGAISAVIISGAVNLSEIELFNRLGGEPPAR